MTEKEALEKANKMILDYRDAAHNKDEETQDQKAFEIYKFCTDIIQGRIEIE